MDIGHPFIRELRNGMLWHCTSAAAVREIWKRGSIVPTPGRSNRWGGRPYACQSLGAVCLFDFSTPSIEQIVQSANRWLPFTRMERPVTVMLGLERASLSGRLVAYPENRDITPKNSCGPIPWVEVCHCGPIPIVAIVSHLLVCAADYSRFRKCELLDEPTLARIETEYDEVVRLDPEGRTDLASKISNSSEFKARMEEVRRRVEAMKRQA